MNEPGSPLKKRPSYLEPLRRQLAGVYTRNPSRTGDRAAAVLLPLVGPPPSFVGILRADHGTPHGGQFALPGGMIENGESAWECAVREAREELGLDAPPEFLGVLGEFNTHVTRFRVIVNVGYVVRIPLWRPQTEEVASIFVIPIRKMLPCLERMTSVEDVWHLPLDEGFEPPTSLPIGSQVRSPLARATGDPSSGV